MRISVQTAVVGLLRLSLRLAGALVAYLLIVWFFLLITGGRYQLFIAILALAVPGMTIRNAWHRLRGARAFRKAYGKAGKDLLIVLTDSPHWQPYIMAEWLPRWGDRAVILNRSRQWNTDSPEGKLWKAVKGGRDHTPLAIVVPQLGNIRVVRFFKAFMGYKHGRALDLRTQEETLAKALPPYPSGALPEG